MMRRSKINNTYHTTSVHYPHFTAHTVCRTFIYSNIIIGMSNAIIDNTRLEDVIPLQGFLFHLLDTTAVSRRFRQGFTKAFHLQFQFYILLYQFIIDGFQVKISGDIIGCVIHRTGNPVG